LSQGCVRVRIQGTRILSFKVVKRKVSKDFTEMVKIVVLSKLPINQIFRVNVLLNLWANYASINLQKNFPLLDMGPNYGLTCTLPLYLKIKKNISLPYYF
jgi:hypothetical protein